MPCNKIEAHKTFSAMQWTTKIASCFVRADVRYFDASQEDEAGRWISET
jgi:SpoIIAA-like